MGEHIHGWIEYKTGGEWQFDQQLDDIGFFSRVPDYHHLFGFDRNRDHETIASTGWPDPDHLSDRGADLYREQRDKDPRANFFDARNRREIRASRLKDVSIEFPTDGEWAGLFDRLQNLQESYEEARVLVYFII